MGEGRAIGVASLLVPFLWPHREKELGPRQRHETALMLRNANEAKAPSPLPLSHKWERGDYRSRKWVSWITGR